MFTWTSKISAGRSTVTVWVVSVVSVTSGLLAGVGLRGGTDHDKATLGARDGTLQQDQALLDVHRVHGDVLGGDGVATHPAGHPGALEDVPGSGAGADGARLAVVAVRAVRGRDAMEAVTLHHAGVALALAGPRDVDLLARAEQLRAELLTDAVRRGVRGADLDDVATGRRARLGEVPGLRLGDLAALDLAVPDLDGVVAVRLWATDLGDHVGARGDDRHRDDAVVLVPGLGHAELGAQQSSGVSFKSAHGIRASIATQSLISMSTPAGRSSRISESTVFGVGSMMSMRRLWVRISKCSRLSLYLWGERMTQ